MKLSLALVAAALSASALPALAQAPQMQKNVSMKMS